MMNAHTDCNRLVSNEDDPDASSITAPSRTSPDSLKRCHQSLDALSFSLADTKGALGPYLNVFLVTQQGWSQSAVGMMTTIGGLIGLVAQTPIGAAIDATKAKRAVVLIALAATALGATIIFARPTFWPVLIANTTIAIFGDVFGPAVATLTLGLFARNQLARRMGRNGAFDHAGNIVIAIVAGGVGWLFGQRAVFLLVPFFAALSAGAVLSIPATAIDYQRARGADTDLSVKHHPVGQSRFRYRPLAIFAACAMLFHFANAPLMPLVGQKLALASRSFATPLMSSCIVAAQLVMLPIALFAGKKADQWGRKPVLLIGFAVLPIRALLYTVSDHSGWLIAVQLLDGVGAGIWDVLTPLVVADLMAGTGQYNFALGIVATAQGIGASLSGLAAGLAVDYLGYNAEFVIAAVVALLALIVLYLGVPETRDRVLQKFSLTPQR